MAEKTTYVVNTPPLQRAEVVGVINPPQPTTFVSHSHMSSGTNQPTVAQNSAYVVNPPQPAGLVYPPPPQPAGLAYPPPPQPAGLVYPPQPQPQPAGLVYPPQPTGYVSHHHTSSGTNQPTVVEHHVYHTGPTTTVGGFLGAVGGALNTGFRETTKVVASVVQPTSALDCFLPGMVVELKSKVGGGKLQLVKNGLLDCRGAGGAACHFRVVSAGRTGVIKLANAAQPNNYVAISKGFVVGYGQGGSECEFVVHVSPGNAVTLESASLLGSHLGALPSGDITSPSQTSKENDVAHFYPHVISL